MAQRVVGPENVLGVFLLELEAALAAEHLRLSEEARMYLGGLLARIHVDRSPRVPGTLASALIEAIQHEPGEMRNLLLRRVGNSALILCGLWWRSVEYQSGYRHGVDQDYHERIGRAAFQRINNDLFQELADNFIGVVDVLARMSDSMLADGSVEVLRLYEMMLRTNNRLAEKMLREQGLILSDDGAKVH
jgi:hypothetical protein